MYAEQFLRIGCLQADFGKTDTLLQPLCQRGAERAIHHEQDVRED